MLSSRFRGFRRVVVDPGLSAARCPRLGPGSRLPVPIRLETLPSSENADLKRLGERDAGLFRLAFDARQRGGRQRRARNPPFTSDFFFSEKGGFTS